MDDLGRIMSRGICDLSAWNFENLPGELDNQEIVEVPYWLYRGPNPLFSNWSERDVKR